jgi:outer membrane immunogenic protein
MMRSIITAFGLTALATSAIAADLPVKAPPPAPAPVYAWTGCYIGGNIGWAHVSRDFNNFNFGAFDNGNHNSDGFAGGGQIGCDYQFSSNWVIGIQGMFDGTDIKRDHFSVVFPGLTFHSKVQWFGTVTGRLGYLLAPSFMIYAKGGWGEVNGRVDVFNTATGAILSTGNNRNVSGGDVGGGLEWMFTPNWSLWLEYDHIFGENKTLVFTNLQLVTFSQRVNRDLDKVLVGINWRFGWPFGGGPVRAAY